jgi:hypothetical protein
MTGTLATGRVRGPLLQHLSQQRCFSCKFDIEKTPYPKTVQGFMGL